MGPGLHARSPVLCDPSKVTSPSLGFGLPCDPPGRPGQWASFQGMMLTPSPDKEK